MPIVDARVVVVWANGAIDAVNTAHVQFDDTVIGYQAAADSIRDAFATRLVPQLSNGAILTEVKVGDDVNGAVATSGAQGGKNQNQLPPNNSYGITKVVATGRNGRWFVPGVVEENVDNNGRLTAAEQSLMNTVFGEILTDTLADGVTWTVEQKDGSFAPVASFSARNSVARQGRRLDRARGF